MSIDVPQEFLPANQLGRVHFIGIGGAGLSAIARIMASMGIQVQGSDARDSALIEQLRREGIECFVGHDAATVERADTVIASTAVRDDNVELIRARELGLRVWPRSAALRSVMFGRRTLAVAGTHGKTTTTAMATWALRGAGIDPGFAIGADVPSLGTNAAVGTDAAFVVEADESDGAFLHYAPEGAVVTNVDADHLDVWGTREAYEAAFEDFVATLGRFVVCSADDPVARRLAEVARGRGLRVVTAGLAADADVRGTAVEVTAEGTSFDLTCAHGVVPVRLAVTGQHYAQDALLAAAAALELTDDAPGALAGIAAELASYTGAARRMEFKGEHAGIKVYDSYAHHPTELEADLAAARRITDGRIVAVFQPHLVSRTRLFGAQMGRALSSADLVFVVDIYVAREEPDPTVGVDLVLDAVEGPQAFAVGPVGDAARAVVASLREGDVLLTLGAGDITTVGPQLLELLREDAR